MGDLFCRLCSGPHPTRHHGARDPADEKPPPQQHEFGGICKDWLRAIDAEASCCTSCHLEEEDGYDSMCEREIDGKWYLVCCQMPDFEEKRKP